VIDEAHHLLPASRKDMVQSLPADMDASVFITVHPEAMLCEALKTIEVIIAVGESAADVIANFCKALDEAEPEFEEFGPLGSDQVLGWFRKSGRAPFVVKVDRPRPPDCFLEPTEQAPFSMRYYADRMERMRTGLVGHY